MGCTPISQDASTTSCTRDAGPDSVQSSSHASLMSSGRRSRSWRSSAPSMRLHLLDVPGRLPVVAVVRERDVHRHRAALDRPCRREVVADDGRDHVREREPVAAGSGDAFELPGDGRARRVRPHRAVGDLGRQARASCPAWRRGGSVGARRRSARRRAARRRSRGYRTAAVPRARCRSASASRRG